MRRKELLYFLFTSLLGTIMEVTASQNAEFGIHILDLRKDSFASSIREGCSLILLRFGRLLMGISAVSISHINLLPIQFNMNSGVMRTLYYLLVFWQQKEAHFWTTSAGVLQFFLLRPAAPSWFGLWCSSLGLSLFYFRPYGDFHIFIA